jgi:hypothetical protein
MTSCVPLFALEVRGLRRAGDKLGRLLRVLPLAFMVMVGNAVAAEKPQLTDQEMKALLGMGLSFSSMDMQGGKNFTGRVTYASDGTLSGTITFTGRPSIAFAGTWKLDGSRLCRTIVPLQPQEVCETWLKSGEKEVTIRVGASEIAVSRW